MTVAITSTLVSGLTDTEQCNGMQGTLSVSALNESIQLTGASSPAVTKRAAFSQALTSGAATIDLTALPGLTGDETVTGLNLKVQFVKFQNPAGNANKIAIAQGASNPHRLDGATSWSIVLAPGQSALINCNGASDTIVSGHKTWDLAGTGAQALNVQVTMG